MAKLAISVLVVTVSVVPTAAGELPLQEGRSAIRQDWTSRVERSRQESARFIGAAVDAFRVRRAPLEQKRQPLVSLPVTYLQDPTLRYGDVIAVEGKLIVFRGDNATLHRASDFEEIGRAGTLGGIHDRELHAIDDALASSRGSGAPRNQDAR